MQWRLPCHADNKKGGPQAAISVQIELLGDYMPEPWIPFQEASMAFTALSGSGT
jgi:hypothetical protein